MSNMFPRYTELGNSITLAGPRKPYTLKDKELRILGASGVSTDHRMAWCYKHIIIRGCRLDTPPPDLQHNLSCNAFFTTDKGGLYFLEQILLYERRYTQLLSITLCIT